MTAVVEPGSAATQIGEVEPLVATTLDPVSLPDKRNAASTMADEPKPTVAAEQKVSPKPKVRKHRHMATAALQACSLNRCFVLVSQHV